jgi:hypothetical protein
MKLIRIENGKDIHYFFPTISFMKAETYFYIKLWYLNRYTEITIKVKK